MQTTTILIIIISIASITKSFGMETDLHQQAWEGNLDGCKTEIILGTDINSLDADKRTPLHNAALFSKNKTVCQFLLENGANVNAKDQFTNSPLHYVLMSITDDPIDTPKILELCELFIDFGADINYKNSDGKSPLDYAQEGPIKDFFNEEVKGENLAYKLRKLKRNLYTLKRKLAQLKANLRKLSMSFKQRLVMTKNLVWQHNWCWMDASLQCFSAIPWLIEQIDTAIQYGRIKKSTPTKKSFIHEFSRVLRHLRKNDKNVKYNAENFYEALHEHNSSISQSFTKYSQQDATLHCITPILNVLTEKIIITHQYITILNAISESEMPHEIDNYKKLYTKYYPNIIFFEINMPWKDNVKKASFKFSSTNSAGQTFNYKLIAILLKAGNASGGHETAITRGFDGKWRHYNDMSRLSPTELLDFEKDGHIKNEILEHKIHGLFYVRE